MWKVIYEEFNKFYPLPDYCLVKIEVTDKMTRAAGYTFPDINTIKLSSILINNVPTLWTVMAHELAHLHLFFKHGVHQVQPHGREFKNIIRFFNYNYPRLPKLSVLHSIPLKFKYDLFCKNCNAILKN